MLAERDEYGPLLRLTFDRLIENFNGYELRYDVGFPVLVAQAVFWRIAAMLMFGFVRSSTL